MAGKVGDLFAYHNFFFFYISTDIVAMDGYSRIFFVSEIQTQWTNIIRQTIKDFTKTVRGPRNLGRHVQQATGQPVLAIKRRKRPKSAEKQQRNQCKRVKLESGDQNLEPVGDKHETEMTPQCLPSHLQRQMKTKSTLKLQNNQRNHCSKAFRALCS